jgi:uncharacterized protein YuzE
MKADYDSEADALSIELTKFKRYDRQESVDDDNCHVGIVADRAVDIELLYPARHLDLLGIAAERYDLDSEALLAAAKAALAAPDRLITMDLSGSLVA